MPLHPYPRVSEHHISAAHALAPCNARHHWIRSVILTIQAASRRFSRYRSSVPLTELTIRESRVDGIVKFFCAERFPQELEVILLKSGSL